MTDPTDDASRWVRRYHARPDAAVRLVCLPHAGGSASFFFPFSRALPADLEAVAVQYPGRQDRHAEPLIPAVPELADAVYAALLPWADRPLAFFGHSMGAILAFEVARRFEREKGLVAAALFASGRRGPTTHRDERVHERDDQGLLDELRSLSGTDSQVLGDEELLRMVLPAIRSDYRAIETYAYRPGPPLRCPVHVLTGDTDPKVTAPEAAAWSEVTTHPARVHTYPGGHFFLTTHQAAIRALVTDTLRAGLATGT
ncbi:alpha/beta fold hydrolase [Streptomyces sp. DSM 44917]|uniref:Alpha/beta fold hydrolase n=1 Tax=Streptomyces boetiae TaxID=3075541 RepID=A0ABU2LDX7_9ACTN|nr:alpha/beta fold hydrolase [Streptomyces sp. DSM 44917]MDT0309690.1 alpha/beta fold hydrolase [Streptomyces sp. DSM 44917]